MLPFFVVRRGFKILEWICAATRHFFVTLAFQCVGVQSSIFLFSM